MKKIRLLIPVASALLIVGCANGGGSSEVTSGGSNTSVSESTTSESTPSSEASSSIEIVNHPDTPSNYYQLNSTEYLAGSTHYDVRTSDGYVDMPSTGDQKLLVIPVEFTDAPASSLAGGAEQIRSYIHDTFFGETGTTSWYSLAEYYSVSSFNHLNFSGEVTNWWNCGLSKSEAAAGGTANVHNIVNSAVAWYKNVNGEESTKQYDTDGDGYVDAVYLIYSASIYGDATTSDDDFYWAYVTWTDNNPNVASPVPFNFMWASWQFMFEAEYKSSSGTWNYSSIASGTAKVDAHTFIHETGHLMGLEDYYTYDDPTVDYEALGGLDMMDYNIGDHNIWSKWILGWADPIVVTDSTSLTLEPSNLNGQFVLLAPSYKNQVYGEYILLEFYAPTILNEKDAVNRYAGYYPLNYSEYGVKIYHVDARIAEYSYSVSGNNVTFTLIDYVDAIGESNYYQGLAHYNTKSYSMNPAFKLISIMEPGDRGTLKTKIRQQGSSDRTLGYYNLASNSFLFQEGDTFGYDSFANYKLDSGDQLGFRFAITSLTEEGVNISFDKLA